LLLEEHDRRGTFSLRRFYARRARRLGPALAVTLLAYIVLEAALAATGYPGDSLSHTAISVGAGLFFVANEAIAYGHLGHGLAHLWSLGLEEQFYLVWPVALLLLLRRNVRERRLVTCLLAIVAAIVSYYVVEALDPNLGHVPTWVGPLLEVGPILCGCAAALTVRRVARLTWGMRILATLALPGLAWWLVLGRSATDARLEGVFVGLLFWLLSAVLIGGVVLGDRTLLVGRILSARWLVAIGKVSYGLYLYHALLLNTIPHWFPSHSGGVIASWLAELASIPLAFASYYLYERRFRFAPRAKAQAMPVFSVPGAA
jgi:peptidoglycan/LPS O-acetylase OafA/YrhL